MTVFFGPRLGVFVDGAIGPSVPGTIRTDPLFRQIERLALGIPIVRCHATPTRLHLEPTSPDGLPVSIYRTYGRQTVCIGGWYDDVDDDAVVLSLVEKAIHGRLRLRMESDGRAFHTFTVEVRHQDGAWLEAGQMTTGYWFRKKPVRALKYLCNESAGQPLTRQNVPAKNEAG